MNTATTTRNKQSHGWRIAIAAGAIAMIATGCGSEISPPANDIGGTTKTHAPREYDNRARMDFGDGAAQPSKSEESERDDSRARMDFGDSYAG